VATSSHVDSCIRQWNCHRHHHCFLPEECIHHKSFGNNPLDNNLEDSMDHKENSNLEGKSLVVQSLAEDNKRFVQGMDKDMDKEEDNIRHYDHRRHHHDEEDTLVHSYSHNSTQDPRRSSLECCIILVEDESLVLVEPQHRLSLLED